MIKVFSMNPFHTLLAKVSSTPYHDQMIRFTAPLGDYLGINHFWYYRITYTGYYSYLGTHTAWNEYCFDHAMTSHFPCLRHPNRLSRGVCLMKKNASHEYKKVLQTAWDKFRINFNINLVQNIPEGIEAFGFATCVEDLSAEEKLLNELPLLRYFIKVFRERHQKLFHLLEDNQIHLSAHFGPVFYEQPKEYVFPMKREHFLSKMGLQSIFLLTQRELDIIKYLSHGYPASYIAKQLCLSLRTVENYIATIKSKLSCSTKVELIRKAKEIATILAFD